MVVCGDRLNSNFSEELAKKLSARLFYPDVTQFPDGELRVRILEQILGEEVTFVKFFEPDSVNSGVLLASFILNALKNSGAGRIKGILPYFPYVRSDHQEKEGEAVNLEVIARLFESSGLDELVTFDPHTIKFPQFFTIKVHVLSAESLFAEEIGRKIKNTPFSLVSPDAGGLRLIQPLSEIFHHSKIVTVKKTRGKDGEVFAENVEGTVEKICVIVDDIISTGGTMREAIRILKKRGAEEFYIFATHAVLAENAFQNLSDSAIEKIFLTDSIPHALKDLPKTSTLQIIDLVRL